MNTFSECMECAWLSSMTVKWTVQEREREREYDRKRQDRAEREEENGTKYSETADIFLAKVHGWCVSKKNILTRPSKALFVATTFPRLILCLKKLNSAM